MNTSVEVSNFKYTKTYRIIINYSAYSDIINHKVLMHKN